MKVGELYRADKSLIYLVLSVSQDRCEILWFQGGRQAVSVWSVRSCLRDKKL